MVHSGVRWIEPKGERIVTTHKGSGHEPPEHQGPGGYVSAFQRSNGTVTSPARGNGAVQGVIALFGAALMTWALIVFAAGPRPATDYAHATACPSGTATRDTSGCYLDVPVSLYEINLDKQENCVSVILTGAAIGGRRTVPVSRQACDAVDQDYSFTSHEFTGKHTARIWRGQIVVVTEDDRQAPTDAFPTQDPGESLLAAILSGLLALCFGALALGARRRWYRRPLGDLLMVTSLLVLLSSIPALLSLLSSGDKNISYVFGALGFSGLVALGLSLIFLPQLIRRARRLTRTA